MENLSLFHVLDEIEMSFTIVDIADRPVTRDPRKSSESKIIFDERNHELHVEIAGGWILSKHLGEMAQKREYEILLKRLETISPSLITQYTGESQIKSVPRVSVCDLMPRILPTAKYPSDARVR